MENLLKWYKFTFAVNAMLNLSNRSQKTSKCGGDISNTLACGLCATFCSYHIIKSFYY